MGLDEELEIMENGAETQAEQIDEETETLDVEEFQDDEEFAPQAEETDLEDAYEHFFEAEGPAGEGEVATDGSDGGLATAVEDATGLDLSEEGFHVVDADEAAEMADDLGGAVAVSGDGEPYADLGTIDSYDADGLSEDASDVTVVEPADNEDGYEVVELELDDDDIAYYLEDEDGNEIGFALIEDGREVEYYYVEEGADGEPALAGSAGSGAADGEDFEPLVTAEGVAEATDNMNAIYKDGIAVAGELKSAFDDIMGALDFSDLVKKPKK